MASETLCNDTAGKTIVVEPAALDIGAEIVGVDLSQSLSNQERKEIWAAFVQWKVIYFRDQKLNKRSFINFSRQFGALNRGHNIHDVDPKFPEIYGVVKGRQSNRQSGQPAFDPWTGWHTDLTPAVNPPTASILWGQVVPPNAGDTQWTNLVAAYDALSSAMKEIVDGLRGVHTYLNYGGITPTPEYMERIAKNQKVSEHPIVRVHPESGCLLYTSPSPRDLSTSRMPSSA